MSTTKLPYEILLRGNADGTFSGGHVIPFDANGQPGLALPIGTDAHPWPEVLGQVNEALAAQAAKADEIKAQLDAMTEERDTALQQRNEAVAKLATVDPDFQRAILEARKADLDKQLAALPTAESQPA